jgi:hypothetical protein
MGVVWKWRLKVALVWLQMHVTYMVQSSTDPSILCKAIYGGIRREWGGMDEQLLHAGNSTQKLTGVKKKKRNSYAWFL